MRVRMQDSSATRSRSAAAAAAASYFERSSRRRGRSRALPSRDSVERHLAWSDTSLGVGNMLRLATSAGRRVGPGREVRLFGRKAARAVIGSGWCGGPGERSGFRSMPMPEYLTSSPPVVRFPDLSGSTSPQSGPAGNYPAPACTCPGQPATQLGRAPPVLSMPDGKECRRTRSGGYHRVRFATVPCWLSQACD